MSRDARGELIGKGEETARDILKILLPGWRQLHNVKISDLEKNYRPRGYHQIAEEHLKSSVDIVCISPTVIEGAIPKPKQLVLFRVQGPGHGHEKGNKHALKAKFDRVQAEMLHDWGLIYLVDLEPDNSPQLFKEKLNYLSIWEVAEEMRTSGVPV